MQYYAFCLGATPFGRFSIKQPTRAAAARRLCTASAVAVVCSVGSGASATTVNWTFSGAVTSITGSGTAPNTVQVGSTVSGVLSYDPSTVSQTLITPIGYGPVPAFREVTYLWPIGDPSATLSYNIGGNSWSSNNSFEVSIQNDQCSSSCIDVISVQGQNTAGYGLNMHVLQQSSAVQTTMLSSDALPTTMSDVDFSVVPAIAGYSGGQIFVHNGNTDPLDDYAVTFALDPSSFMIGQPVTPQPSEVAVLFRETAGFDAWYVPGDGIGTLVGWDHVALQYGSNIVYEAHPGYVSGVYTDVTGTENVPIQFESLVQAQHTRGTFEYDAPLGYASSVTNFDAITIPVSLATSMRDAIQSQIDAGATYYDLGQSTVQLLAGLSSYNQKGGNGSFSCVGLIEWAAEQAGLNGGEGFIPNRIEASPVLSPSLLHFAMTNANFAAAFAGIASGGISFLTAIFDPVDFLITDSLGRRVGYVSGQGQFNEIPDVYYSGDGQFEQLFMLNAPVGGYALELFGQSADANVLIGGSGGTLFQFNGFLGSGEHRSFSLGETDVAPIPVPATMPLMAGGLGLLWSLSKRKRPFRR